MSAVIWSTDTRRAPSERVALIAGPAQRSIAFGPAGGVSRSQFLVDVAAVAAALPDARHAVNLCEDRYRFLVVFCAAATRGQTSLLPPSRTPAAIADVLVHHPDSVCVVDRALDPAPPRQFVLPPLPAAASQAAAPEHAVNEHAVDQPAVDASAVDEPAVDDAAIAMIAFTSGSTGTPKANPKTWRDLRLSTAQNLAALADLWPAAGPARVVATVPPQHMYGMELSVLLPLLGDVAVHVGRPFFPDDVARSLDEAGAPGLLVTTPVHLRALLESGVALPPLAGIVTATAPLSQALAAAAEARYGCEVRELFGSTETCVIAQRRTAQEEHWRLFPSVRLQSQPDGTLVHAPHLPAPVALADLVETDGDGRFALCGRQADLLEIAGKRASLGDLTKRLLAVPGVIDGAVVQLDPCAITGVRRIAAIAVAPGLDEAAILAALRASIDPVFLPRKLRCVAALPRNDTGKLPRAAVLALLQ